MNKKINKIVELLKAGAMIRINDCDLYINNGLLHWASFGESANEFNEHGLTFVLNTIAKYNGVAYINASHSHFAPAPMLIRI